MSLSTASRPGLLAGRLAAALVAALACLLAGCATPPPEPPPEPPAGHGGAVWQPVALPGKMHTQYSWEPKDGRASWAARSERSASMLRKKVHVHPGQLGDVSFSWWVPHLIEGSSVAEADREDAPARVLFGFAGDVDRLPMRTRMMFELAQALTGEAPPYATLMYVYDTALPVGSVIVNPRTDRIRKIVIDSGPGQLGRWRDHRRNLAEDFRRAFGEEPGTLVSVALMTDSDNTRSQAQCWYGPVALH